MNRLTFGLQVVVAFFAFDAIRRLAAVAALFQDGRFPPSVSRIFVDFYFPLLLAVSFDLLLAAQIALRTRAGRFWGMIYLAVSTALGLYLLVVEPGRWIELDRVGRLQEIGTYGANAGLFAILAGRRSARVLTR